MVDDEDFDLKKYEVPNLPSAAYYVPEFISSEEERALMARVYGAPRPKWTQLAHRRLQNWGGLPSARGMLAERLPAWLQVQSPKWTHRRLQNWGGLPSARGMLAERLPAWLQEVVSRVARATRDVLPASAPPNHVLVNEYAPGQGILPHTDGDLFYPVIATVSTGSHTVLRFSTPRSDAADPADGAGGGGREVGGLLLEARSLVVLTGDLYPLLHRIDALPSDTLDRTLANLGRTRHAAAAGDTLPRDTRLSFTIRHVPKTTTFKLNIGNKT